MRIFRLKLLAVVALVTIAATTAAKTKVACIGNSITYGYKLPDREAKAYPAQLQRLLGSDFEVRNFGHSGATLLRKGHNPYNALPEFHAALAFCPGIAVIHLGVNDTDPRNWPNYNTEFVVDYLAIIDSLRAVNPNVRIILAELSPLRASHFRFRTGTRDWRLLIQEAIRNVARASGAELIDFDAPLRDRQNLITDGIHPNAEGAVIMAETVCGAITGYYGGLKLPEIMQSGMVLQRNRPLTFRGRADAGAVIALTLDNRTYHATTDNRGDWVLTTAPLVSGPTYTLTVTDGKTTQTLTDILAGEVWLASGQSNMEFQLRRSIGGEEEAAKATDRQLRIFDMKPIAHTDRFKWNDSILDAMDALGHYAPTRWQKLSPDNARELSAVAYFFARQLRDSLQVPVGIISNAVGGSPTESWVDVNTLEVEMPGILVNWRTNDYLQKWVQKRVGENIGDRPNGRHPYEPSYLFAAGIRPLRSFPIAGVIWYQGESNAHNIELHEQLFPMVVDSWRREFNLPRMPFYFVQLSSIDRPSWAEFRDSQRRLADRIPGVGMVVSHDVGDSLDVHPRDKRPVGERLARLALRRTYGFDGVTDQGPTLRSAVASSGSVTLVFDCAEGLTTSDGLAPRVFEIAEIDGVYYPAEAIISDNKIILKNMNVKNPRYVRYAWQPFTRSNVVNAAGLPASTFKAEVSNAADFDIEPGYERGVSAAFCGRIGNSIFVAGGANFPCDEPLSPKAEKKLYRGIYAADVDNPRLTWRRVGSLPEAMAYGASAMTERGPVFIGTDKSVWLLNADGTLTDLPEMPVAIDNAAAASIGSVVYVCGGNIDGKPSNALYSLDLNSGKWRKLRSMPGNPRVQPAMTASNDELWLWGGFAGRYEGRDATLETSGLRYEPKKDRWTPLPAPTDAEGNEISLGGGCAVTLSDARIVAFGGVNKDIFLDELRNQAPDYLLHPIDWYRFNKNVLLFDPTTSKWSVAETTTDVARAGAAAISGLNGDIFIYGGELKPRIRTAETLHIQL